MQNLRYHISKRWGAFVIIRIYMGNAYLNNPPRQVGDYLCRIGEGLEGAEWTPCGRGGGSIWAHKFETEESARIWLTSELLGSSFNSPVII